MNELDIKNLMSIYLLDGYKQDVIEIDRVTFDEEDGKNKFSFHLKINETFMSSKYGIFFSGITAEVWIYQACVVLAHLDNDLTENSKEIILQEKFVTYKKPVPADNIVVSATVSEKRTTSKGQIQYKFDINVSDAIVGHGIAVF
ncbi:hypothetical protein [Pleionea sediminis]|uniref:hypothetical protein n=1 Tax=Pleionea sediminis TaxID=2569479 RepID=UPI0011858551|nr:hypothetical protein [Pleionea sediminis]